MSLNLPEVDYKFIKLSKGHKLDNFKNDYYYLVPQYEIYINGEEFKYFNSSNALNTYLKSKRLLKGNLVTNKDREFFEYVGKKVLPLEIYIPISIPLDDMGKLHALYCILEEAMLIINNPYMDDFIVEMGYDGSLSNVRKGESVFRDLVDNRKKLKYTDDQIQELITMIDDIYSIS